MATIREDQTYSGILAYHEVMPESTYSYCVTCEALAQQLRLVQELTAAKGAKLPARITFDDGEQSQFLYAFPLLARYETSAIFFVTPRFIGTEAKFLGWSRLRELQDAGHSIQSHGWSHKFLTLCGEQELARELRASKEKVEECLGRTVSSIAAPGGRWDQRVVEACAAAGYKQLYVSDPWVARETAGVQVLGRFIVRRTTTLAELARVLQRDRRTLWRLRMRSKVKQRLVSLIGDGRYHRLWRRLNGYVEFEQARRKMYS